MMADAVPLAASAKMAAFPLEGVIVPAGCMVQSMTNATHNDMIFIPTLYGGGVHEWGGAFDPWSRSVGL